MDFFKYTSIAVEFAPKELWVQLLLGGLCFAIVFIFEAIALYTIAVRNGYKNKWMAFIPFFNTYYIGVCSEKNRFYNVSTKTIGLATAILEVVLVGLYTFSLVSSTLIDPYLVEVEDTYLGMSVITYQINVDAVPENLKWAAWVFMYMDRYILRIVNFIFIILDMILLICFFQTYASRRYVLFAVTSILFPVMGILFFIVRNNKGVTYKDFVRAEQAKQYEQYQQYRQQNYNNPYNQSNNQNPYNRNNSQSGSDPFDGLGGTDGNAGGDPFDDFDKK